jgi:hypothetical protein
MSKQSNPHKKTKHVRLYVTETTTCKRQQYVEVIIPQSATKKQIEELGIQLCEDGTVYFDRHDELSNDTNYACDGIEKASNDSTESQEWLLNAKGDWEEAD